jgi:hypothetical protein
VTERSHQLNLPTVNCDCKLRLLFLTANCDCKLRLLLSFHFRHHPVTLAKNLKTYIMIADNRGKWYDEVFLQVNYPEVADVSAEDYTAKTFKGNQVSTEQRPFIICAKEEVTLKVLPWLGEAVVWTFPAGPYPMPIKKILNDQANTATSIQIAY